MPTWRDVTDYIGKDVLRIIHEADSKQMLTGYQLLLSGNKALSGAFVHLVDSRVLENVGIQSGNALIVKLSSEEDIENINIPESNLAVFCGDSQEAYVVQRMNELFSVHQNVEVLLSKMQRIVSGNKGLNALLSEVADFFRMPVDILDNSFRFIAVSDNKWLQSPMREEYAAKERYIPAFVLDELQSSGQLKQIIESVTAVRIDGENYKAWAYPLITNRVKIGYMMFFEPPNLRKNEGLIREYLTYLPFISSFICMELGKQTFFNLNKGDYYNFILSTLLNGKEKDFESVRQRLRISNYKLEKNLYLICVEPKAEGQSSRWMQTVAVHLRDLFANSFYINRGGKLFYMVSRASSDTGGTASESAFSLQGILWKQAV